MIDPENLGEKPRETIPFKVIRIIDNSTAVCGGKLVEGSRTTLRFQA
jgi:hypothetical protein